MRLSHSVFDYLPTPFALFGRDRVAGFWPGGVELKDFRLRTCRNGTECAVLKFVSDFIEKLS